MERFLRCSAERVAYRPADDGSDAVDDLINGDAGIGSHTAFFMTMACMAHARHAQPIRQYHDYWAAMDNYTKAACKVITSVTALRTHLRELGYLQRVVSEALNMSRPPIPEVRPDKWFAIHVHGGAMSFVKFPNPCNIAYYTQWHRY